MYKPSDDLLEAVQNLIPLETCPWDDYYMRMAQTDFLSGRANLKASKTFFIRNAPFKGSYALLGGLTAFLRTLHEFEFTSEVCIALKDQDYREDFIKSLKGTKVNVTIYSLPEGGVFFPNEPAITLEGTLLNVRIAEGMLLKNVNFPTLSMTKWRRVVQAADKGMVLEFARRRAQDDLRTSLYAHLAGAQFTSNADVRKGANIKVRGTMGHEGPQSEGDEFKYFDTWLEYNPDRPVLLVDTIDTLKSGIPNAIKAFKKHWDRIKNAGGIPGVRNDSGDLAYLTIEERRAFLKEGLDDIWIYETNDLDEYSIENIREQIYTNAPRAGLDKDKTISQIVWACGTQPGTCSDQPSLGGVAKLSTIEYRGKECAVIKLAHDNPIKTSIPGSNRSAWIRENDELLCCLIYGKDEDLCKCTSAYHPDDENKKIILQHYGNLEIIYRQKQVYNPTDGILEKPSLQAVRERVNIETAMLHWTHKRLQNPHPVKVSLSDKLFHLRQKLIWNNSLIDK